MPAIVILPTILLPTVCQQPVAVAELAAICATPMFVSRVSAGFPSPATDYMQDGLDLNEYLVQHKAASFIFEVKGDSMKNAGIMDGDKVVVDRSIEARHGKIVIAVVESEFTIKRLYRRGGRVELRPENPAYNAIVFEPDAQLEIWGVVVGAVRRY
jgi:DNA polymerase V